MRNTTKTTLSSLATNGVEEALPFVRRVVEQVRRQVAMAPPVLGLRTADAFVVQIHPTWADLGFPGVMVTLKRFDNVSAALWFDPASEEDGCTPTGESQWVADFHDGPAKSDEHQIYRGPNRMEAIEKMLGAIAAHLAKIATRQAFGWEFGADGTTFATERSDAANYETPQ